MMSAAVGVVPRAAGRPVAIAGALVLLAGYLGYLAVDRLIDSSGLLGVPGLGDLYLFLGLPVAGLLGLRVLVGGRLEDGTVARWSARWGALWAGLTATCLVFTTARAAGVAVWDLPSTTDNLIPVMASHNTVLAQSAVLWVALLVAFFSPALTSRRENGALLLLTLVAVLGAVPTGFTGPSHGGHTFHPLVVAAAVAQLVTLASWLGAAVALVGHRRLLSMAPAVLLRRYAVAASIGVAVMGAAGLVSRSASLTRWGDLWTSVEGGVILGEAVLIGLVLNVGWRHRRRMVESLLDLLPSGVRPPAESSEPTTRATGGRLLYLLVGSDVVLGLVVLGLSVLGATSAG